MISLIMPFFNRFDLVMRRMAEFHSFVKMPKEELEIIILNDASTEDVVEENIFFWQKMVNWFNVRYIKWEKNVGFGGSMNRGAEKANGEHLCFFSDDVIISGNFIPKIVDILREEPTALIGGEVIWWAAGWNEFEIDGKKTVVPYANGWLLAVSKSTWVEGGGFDPRYYPYDYEDVDISTRWHEMGYNIRALESPYVKHIGGATISGLDKNRIEKTQLHRQLYIEKWKDKLSSLNSEKENGRNVRRRSDGVEDSEGGVT